jgi:hypothetical protein
MKYNRDLCCDFWEYVIVNRIVKFVLCNLFCDPWENLKVKCGLFVL